MSLAKITLVGFYNHLNDLNDDLFKYLNVPAGIDKDLLVNTILQRGAEFEVLYSDPYFFQNMVGVWSGKWQRTIERWANALSIDYDPLENYDRREDWEDTGHKVSTALSANDGKTERKENAAAHDQTSTSAAGNTENTRSAYNSYVYQPHDKEGTNTSGTTNSNSLTNAMGSTSNEETTRTNALDNTNALHSGRVHGNIGVTTSQQMLEAELKISKWNIYEEIANLFVNEFCLYVY